MIYVSIDIETTGVDPKIHDIVEFGAVIDDLANPQPLDKLPRFHALFKKDNYFEKIPACKDSFSTGCYVSWRTFKSGYIEPVYIRKFRG